MGLTANLNWWTPDFLHELIFAKTPVGTKLDAEGGYLPPGFAKFPTRWWLFKFCVHMGVSLNGGTPISHPKCWSFLVGKPMVVGYQHFRKPPYVHTISIDKTDRGNPAHTHTHTCKYTYIFIYINLCRQPQGLSNYTTLFPNVPLILYFCMIFIYLYYIHVKRGMILVISGIFLSPLFLDSQARSQKNIFL